MSKCSVDLQLINYDSHCFTFLSPEYENTMGEVIVLASTALRKRQT
jgi:hypothetical protein